MKRGIGGVHHSVSAKYLQTYLDEYAFRYDRRGMYGMVFKEILGEVSKQAVLIPASANLRRTHGNAGASSLQRPWPGEEVSLANSRRVGR